MKLFGIGVIFSVLFWGALCRPALAQKPTEQSYLVYVLSEAAAKISLLRFDCAGALIEKEFTTGLMEIIDLEVFKTVATVDVAPQPAGIGFFRIGAKPGLRP